mgnify:CR=1 FL=1
MDFSLIWKLSIFIWCNIIFFLCVTYVFITVFVNPFGVKEAMLPDFFNTFKTSKQDKNNNPLECDNNVETVEENSLCSDKFKEEFDKRINNLKNELNTDEFFNDLPEEIEEKFFTYDEKEEYTPDLYDAESGVEIITDAYEKRIEERLS